MEEQPMPGTEGGSEILHPHLEEDVLEQYAVGTLSEESLPQVEEHLLICSGCQSQLAEIDEFLRLFRIARTHLDVEPTPFWNRMWAFPQMRWCAAVALSVLLLVFVHVSRRTGDTTEAIVNMQSLRGADTGAHVSAGRAAVLIFDVPTTESANYRLQIRNPAGANVLETGTAVRNGRLTASIQRLARGDYWVQLYRPSDNKLMAEYSLHAD